MSKAQSATASTIFILGGVVLSFFIPALGAVSVLIGGILLVVRMTGGAANAGTEHSKACPYCAETIKVEAKVCRFCGRDLIAPPVAASDEHTPAPTLDRERLMKQFGITFDGERYHYRQHRYDKFEDAVNYAIQTQNRT